MAPKKKSANASDDPESPPAALPPPATVDPVNASFMARLHEGVEVICRHQVFADILTAAPLTMDDDSDVRGSQGRNEKHSQSFVALCGSATLYVGGRASGTSGWGTPNHIDFSVG